jgi:hypothetical protein
LAGFHICGPRTMTPPVGVTGFLNGGVFLGLGVEVGEPLGVGVAVAVGVGVGVAVGVAEALADGAADVLTEGELAAIACAAAQGISSVPAATDATPASARPRRARVDA